MEMQANGVFGQDLPGTQKKERTFELSLPALVRGFDAADREFSEKTAVSSLSAQEAVFWLRAKVTRGTKLALNLLVPQTSMLEKKLEVRLTGTVDIVRSDAPDKTRHRLIAVKLDRNFQIQA